jgi:hypothetical protein
MSYLFSCLDVSNYLDLIQKFQNNINKSEIIDKSILFTFLKWDQMTVKFSLKILC